MNNSIENKDTSDEWQAARLTKDEAQNIVDLGMTYAKHLAEKIAHESYWNYNEVKADELWGAANHSMNLFVNRMHALSKSPTPQQPPVAEPSADAVREALAELVELKNLKMLIDMATKHPIGTTFEDMTTEYARRKPLAWTAARAALAASSKELIGKSSCRDSGMGWCEIQHIDGGKFCDGGQCLKYKYDGSLKDKP